MYFLLRLIKLIYSDVCACGIELYPDVSVIWLKWLLYPSVEMSVRCKDRFVHLKFPS